MRIRRRVRELYLPALRRAKRVRLLKRGAAVVAVAVVALLVSAWIVPLPKRLRSPVSTVIEYRDGTPAHVFLSGDDKWRVPVRLEDVDPAYLDALVRLEDKRFHVHPGVDPIAIVRAAWLNVTHGHVVSGGSTLTMQLVRVLEPRPRNLKSKAVEALRAMQLELRMSKSEILRAYLQFIPFGRNVEGVEAASLAYFGHNAAALSPEEIATLLAVPQRPNTRYPSPRNVKRLRAARNDIAERLLAEGALLDGDETPPTVLARIEKAGVPGELRPFPREAIHAAMWLRATNPDAVRIRTTLDRGIQRQTEHVLHGAQRSLAARGIYNGSAVVVDHQTSEVRALVGNIDFWDDEHGGQIVGFVQPRSPGSTLKPFLYAMAIDKGLALPEFLVPDVPVRYGTYAPKNFDTHYNGLVTLEDALSRSLNIPMVNLLQDVGVDTFVGSLRGAGAESLESQPGYYGLSAVIGGIELTPLEIAGLYAALADDGRTRPLRWRADQPDAKGTPWLSPGAAWLTRRTLSRKDRPDFPSRREISGAPPQIHWKTGTSYGFRDAWAVGSGPRHTAVIWLGNFDNSPSVDLVGAEAAGPILFDVLEAVRDRASGPVADVAPPDLTEIRVCAYSGHLATDACPETRPALALRNNVPTKRCPYHKAVDVDLDTGKSLTPQCRGGRHYARKSYIVWPTSLSRWLADQQRRFPQPPPLASDCQVGGVRTAPEIVSPPAGQVAMLIPGLAAERQEIPLEAETLGAAGTLKWFVDGRFLGAYPAADRVWWEPEPGIHEILVVDEGGLTTRRRLEVRQP